jgi:hypothetical protein
MWLSIYHTNWRDARDLDQEWRGRQVHAGRHAPNAIRFEPVAAPVNTLGIRRVMFAVGDIDAILRIRGPEGINVALAEQLGQGVPDSERHLDRQPGAPRGGSTRPPVTIDAVVFSDVVP